MGEIGQLVNAYEDALKKNLKLALATVVDVAGSSYRRAGARMLVSEDGRITGAISGGCLEGDALRKALLSILQEQPKLVTYDTRDDEDAKIGLQLGCEGVIRVLFEPVIARDQNNPVELLKKIVAKRQEAVLVTLFSQGNAGGAHPGTVLLLTEDGKVHGNVSALGAPIMEDAREALAEKQSSFKTYRGVARTPSAFLQFIPPPTSLVVVGAGNDAIPLTRMAGLLGWDVWIADGRKSHARQERFTSTCQIRVGDPHAVLTGMPMDAYTAFVLMTHNYNYDLAMLQSLLQHDVPYIGVLGPKKKLDKMLLQLSREGDSFTEDPISNVFGPAGLDIGAETPAEIALSILAEIKAVFSKKRAVFLKDKKGPIHFREIVPQGSKG